VSNNRRTVKSACTTAVAEVARIADTQLEHGGAGQSGRHRIYVISGEHTGRKIVLDGMTVNA
jgi:hypothetical protein